MSELVIRHPVKEDAQALLDFLKIIGSETDNLSFGSEGMPLTQQQEEDYLEQVANGPRFVSFVALIDGEIVGNSSLTMLGGKRTNHRGEISVALQKKAWGKGIAKALMEAVIKETRAKFPVEIISLEVRSDNHRAIALYSNLGFIKTGVIPAFFKIDGQHYDCDQMILSFLNNKLE